MTEFTLEFTATNVLIIVITFHSAKREKTNKMQQLDVYIFIFQQIALN